MEGLEAHEPQTVYLVVESLRFRRGGRHRNVYRARSCGRLESYVLQWFIDDEAWRFRDEAA